LSIRFQADSDLKLSIVKAVRLIEPAIDFASAQDAKLEGVGDPEVLDLAASQNRILGSHDRRTMPHHFRNRLAEGKSSPGLLIAAQQAPVSPKADGRVLQPSASSNATASRSSVPRRSPAPTICAECRCPRH
jgi:hypothetical protein